MATHTTTGSGSGTDGRAGGAVGRRALTVWLAIIGSIFLMLFACGQTALIVDPPDTSSLGADSKLAADYSAWRPAAFAALDPRIILAALRDLGLQGSPVKSEAASNCLLGFACTSSSPTRPPSSTATPTASIIAPTSTDAAADPPVGGSTEQPPSGPGNTAAPTSTQTMTSTATDTNTPTPTETNTPTPTDTDTPTPTETNTPTPTDTDTPTPTETNTPTPTDTDTPEPADTDTPVPTDTDTPEPTATDTPESTATDTPVPPPTNTPRPPTPTRTPCPAGGCEPDIGTPDGLFVSLASGTEQVFSLSSPIVVDGNPDYDLVYYERLGAPGIVYLDLVVVRIGRTIEGDWYIVFDWGDGAADTHSNVGSYGADGTEEPNAEIPTTDLYGTPPYNTGVAIDADQPGIPAGEYDLLSVAAPTPPAGTSYPADQQTEVDAVEILPTSGP